MCFGDKKESSNEQPNRPTQLPPPNANDPGNMSGKPTNSAGYPGQQSYAQQSEYAPPPGPPPSQAAAGQYAPPSGPPPGQAAAGQYAPPPGPPPSHGAGDYAPPPGPPPGQPSAEKKPEAWELAVPDTSLFPPPPAFFKGFDRSPANNATEEQANAGTAWCEAHPLTPPITLDAPTLQALYAKQIRLLAPAGFPGVVRPSNPAAGAARWEVSSPPGLPDTTIIGYPPLYSVQNHSPLAPQHPRERLVYYEVRVATWSRPEISVALGFTALPYPFFRLPGWHRGSLAVHGDDGHRYVNDIMGGFEFTQPFRPGETLGLGIIFRRAGGEGHSRLETEVFFTRNGHRENGWSLHEQMDADVNLSVTGLEGYNDLAPAVGLFEQTAVEVVFEPREWAWQGWTGMAV